MAQMLSGKKFPSIQKYFNLTRMHRVFLRVVSIAFAKSQILAAAKKLMALLESSTILFAQKSRELWNAKGFR